MTLYDDIHQRPGFSQRQERIGYVAGDGSPQSSGLHPLERVFADRSNEQSEMNGSIGYAAWREVIVTWLLAALLVLAFLAIPTPDTPRPGAVSTPTASAPHPKDTAPTRAADPDAPVPCSDLDYAYEKC